MLQATTKPHPVGKRVERVTKEAKVYKKILLLVLGCFLSFIINGCVVRTYSVTRERIDQDLTEGNRGYLMGAPEVSVEKPKKATRQLQVIEIEFHPIKMKAEPPVSKPAVAPSVSVGESSKKKKTIPPVIKPVVASPVESSKVMIMKKYTVRKGDTLQSISNKFYGTTKRWKEIYEVNQEILKSHDKIYPGQIIEIPLEEIVGTK